MDRYEILLPYRYQQDIFDVLDNENPFSAKALNCHEIIYELKKVRANKCASAQLKIKPEPSQFQKLIWVRKGLLTRKLNRAKLLAVRKPKNEQFAFINDEMLRYFKIIQ